MKILWKTYGPLGSVSCSRVKISISYSCFHTPFFHSFPYFNVNFLKLVYFYKLGTFTIRLWLFEIYTILPVLNFRTLCKWITIFGTSNCAYLMKLTIFIILPFLFCAILMEYYHFNEILVIDTCLLWRQRELVIMAKEFTCSWVQEEFLEFSGRFSKVF